MFHILNESGFQAVHRKAVDYKEFAADTAPKLNEYDRAKIK